MRMAVLFLTFAAAVASAVAGEDVVRAKGTGGSYRAAINEALAIALEQHDGMTVSSSEITKMWQNSDGKSVNDNGQIDDKSKLEMNDSINKEIKNISQGRINGFTIVSDTYDPGTKKHCVEVDVLFPGKYVMGEDPDLRRRMVVANFRSASGDTFSWNGQNESTAMWSATVADKLNERFTQTRKFTMIDRKFDAEVQDEIARLSDKNAAKGDIVRLGQRLGTDYMVIGDVKFGTVRPSGVNPITGQTLPAVSQRFAEISYRVILAPTGQLKWADSVTIDSGDVPAGDMLSFVSASTDLAAQRIVEVVMANLLPFEIVGRNGAGEIIIGEGGKSLVAGDRLTVFVLGEEVKDSRTGEVLDQVEEPVATVEIVRVTPKLSYAQVIEGDAAKVVAGARARRPQVLPGPARGGVPPPPPNTSVRGIGNGGVVTPF